MGEEFCEFGMLPKNQCAHCRESTWIPTRGGGYWQIQHPQPPVWEPLDAAEVALRWAREHASSMPWHSNVTWDEPVYISRAGFPPSLWAEVVADAFGRPTQEDWEHIFSIAAISGFGPWIISEHYGVCKGCTYKWEPGEMIRFCEDEIGWVCAECGSVDGDE